MKRHATTTTKDPIVVIRRTRRHQKRNKTKQSRVAASPRQATSTAGIPSFAIRRDVNDHDDETDQHVAPTTATAAKACTAGVEEEEEEEPDYYQDNNDEEIIPSDAYFAMISLQQVSRGLHVPSLGGSDGPNNIQLILEYQILQRLPQKNPSETWKELRDMLRQNKLRAFSMTIVTTTTSNPKHPSHPMITRRVAYMETTAHIQGVWNAHQYHSHANPQYTWIVEWFIEDFLPQHGTTTKPSILTSELEHEWRGAATIRPRSSSDRSSSSSTNTTTTIPSLEQAIRYLMTIQVLRRETTTTRNEESYSLWLPNLGLLLKAWYEARQQVVGLLQRAPGKEVSQKNLLQKNRHASISTPFILQDLQEQGLIQLVERPFGTFVKLVT